MRSGRLKLRAGGGRARYAIRGPLRQVWAGAAAALIDLPISAGDAAKLIVSAGLIQPEGQARFAAMAEAAKPPQRLPDSASAG